MVGRVGSRCWRGRGCWLLAAALAGVCTWRASPEHPAAFRVARALWRSPEPAAAGRAWGSSGSSQATSALREPGLARRADEENPNEREVFGGDDNILSKARPLPPDTERFGDSIWFDIKVKKPLGLRLSEGPDGTGVGVSEIAAEGAIPDLEKEALALGSPPMMWVQEGDELVQVNGESTEDSMTRAVDMVMAAGEEMTLTFSRPARGYIKVVFPGGLAVTSPRVAKLSVLAEKAGYDSGCTRNDGRDEKCWYKDVVTGEVYCLPLHVPGIIPSVWRNAGEEGMSLGTGELDSWVPLRLVPAPEEFQKALADEARVKAQREKARQSRGDGTPFG